ncbi:metallophosphoesterase [Spongiibacter sp. KMU-158]|uniref:Metallophosphoesterase n=1 Tax=Spongiibacter pelagi TaxID=2760804 RepID=A0A927BYQ3_9GAMM|nr:metallophosphoesterase family protein [Spongiibacter pelagi]MBD2857484.1 metallophosphoesterase [Spongiibacter pelagi]
MASEFCPIRWNAKGFPAEGEYWQLGKHGSMGKDRSNHHALAEVLSKAIGHQPWSWPKKPILFISDPHADADAFVGSLHASGGIKKTGLNLLDFKLSKAGKDATFIIGGDCLDKGPSNLDLLRSIRALKDIGANIKLLAGNHDVRLLVGLRSMDLVPDPRTEHFFVRMGPKVIPLFKEVFEEYFADGKLPKNTPSLSECRRKLYPRESWFVHFAKEAAWLMPDEAIERELIRIRKKVDDFEHACEKSGMTLRDIYAAAIKCKALFLKPSGEFSWFFKDMQLAYKAGSFLFIHAGLDDRIATLISEESVAHLNKLYRYQIQHDLFEFYYGALANTMRTKYRDVDMPLSQHGVETAYNSGIHAIVHGHRNRHEGQRIMLRQGMIHFEGDITLDRHSRKKEGLSGIGHGVTVIHPKGQVIGLSNDYPCAKVFEPAHYLGSQ